MLSSLFITNKMFVLAMPALLYQLILEISTELDKLNIVAYDIAWYRIDWAISNPLSRMRGVLFTIICITMMTEAISYKLKRRV